MDARSALDILDLTLLDRDASESDLDELCTLANLHRPASVCVFSEHVAYVAERLDDIAISAVAAGFHAIAIRADDRDNDPDQRADIAAPIAVRTNNLDRLPFTRN